MNADNEPLAVPTNGRGPHPVPEPSESAAPPRPAPPASAVPFSPTQLAVGFGIIASVVAILVRQLRRRSRGGSRGPLGRG